MTTYERWEQRERRKRTAWRFVAWVIITIWMMVTALGLWALFTIVFGLPAPGA